MSILSIKAATLTLMRIPLTSRFFSKDLILEQIIQKRKITEIVIIMITAILTTSYSIKIIITIKSKKKKDQKERKEKPKKENEH
jgi:NADH:ubiquinone oxidoreductase subunit 5 (subunit L)/multisubunit Na+/H+ antiporter MnhA subunit